MLSPELDRLTAGLTRRPGATDADLAAGMMLEGKPVGYQQRDHRVERVPE